MTGSLSTTRFSTPVVDHCDETSTPVTDHRDETSTPVSDHHDETSTPVIDHRDETVMPLPFAESSDISFGNCYSCLLNSRMR